MGTNRIFREGKIVNSKPQLAEVPNPMPQESEEKLNRPHRGLRAIARGLSKRKVCRTAISYVLVVWLNLQIGDVIFPMLGLPDWTLTLIITIGIMGFPVVLILAWAFQITPEGIVLDSGGIDQPDNDRRLDTAVNVVLLLSSGVLSILLILQFVIADGPGKFGSTTEGSGTVFVVSSLTFNPAVNEPENQVLAEQVREELRHRLIQLEGIELLPESASVDPKDERQRLSLSGSLLLDGDSAHVLAHLINLSTGRYLMSVSFEVKVESVLAAELATAQRIMHELEGRLALQAPVAEVAVALLSSHRRS